MRFVAPALLFACASSIAIAQSAPTPGEKAEQTATTAKAAAGPVKPADANRPQIGDFGFDMAGRDTAVQPGRRLLRLRQRQLGEDDRRSPPIARPTACSTSFRICRCERTRDDPRRRRKQPGNKTGDFYASFMDEAAVNAKGIAPVKPWLAAIAGAKDKTALAAEMGKLQRQGVGGLFGVGVDQDDKAPDHLYRQLPPGRARAARPRLLPEGRRQARRGAHRLSGVSREAADARRRAQRRRARRGGVRLREALATAHWTREESRDADKTYNKFDARRSRRARRPASPGRDYAKALGMPTGAGCARRAADRARRRGQGVGRRAAAGAQGLSLMLRMLRTYAPLSVARLRQGELRLLRHRRCRARPSSRRGGSAASTSCRTAMGEAVGQQLCRQILPARGQGGRRTSSSRT